MKNIFFIATVFLSLQAWSAPESCKGVDLTKLMFTGQVDDPTPEKIYNFPKIREQMLLAAQEGNAASIQCYADFYNTAKSEAAGFWAEKLKKSGCDISEAGEITGDCPTKSEAYKSTKYLINFDNELRNDTATLKELAGQIANTDVSGAPPAEGGAPAAGADSAIDPNTEAMASCPTGTCNGRQATDAISDLNAQIDDQKRFCCGLPNAKSEEDEIGLARKIERTLDLIPASLNQQSYNSCVSKMPTNKSQSNTLVGVGKCAVNAIQAFIKGLWEGIKGIFTGLAELWAHRAQIWQIATDTKARQQFINTLMGAISQYIGERMDVMECYKPSEKTQYVCKMIGNIAGTFASPNMAASLLSVTGKLIGTGLKMTSKVLVSLLSKSEKGTKILNATRKVVKTTKAVGSATKKLGTNIKKAPKRATIIAKSKIPYKIRVGNTYKIVTGTVKGAGKLAIVVVKTPIYIAKGVAFVFKLPSKAAGLILKPLTSVTGSARFQNMFYQAGRATKKASNAVAGSQYGLGAQMAWQSTKSAVRTVTAPVTGAARTAVTATTGAAKTAASTTAGVVKTVTAPIVNGAKAGTTVVANGVKKVVGTVIKPKPVPVASPTELGVVYTKNLSVAETANFNNSVGNALSKPYRKPTKTIFVDEPTLVVKPSGANGQSLTLVSGNGSRTLTEVGKIGPKVKPKLIEQPDGSLIVRVGRKTYKLPEKTVLTVTPTPPSLGARVGSQIVPTLKAGAVGTVKTLKPTKLNLITPAAGLHNGFEKAEPNARPEDSVGPLDDAAISDSILAPVEPAADGAPVPQDDTLVPPDDMVLPPSGAVPPPAPTVPPPKGGSDGSAPSPMMDAAEAAGM